MNKPLKPPPIALLYTVNRPRPPPPPSPCHTIKYHHYGWEVVAFAFVTLVFAIWTGIWYLVESGYFA